MPELLQIPHYVMGYLTYVGIFKCTKQGVEKGFLFSPSLGTSTNNSSILSLTDMNY